MEKVYFVRHGESEGNTSDIRQTGTSSLTDYGRKQSDCLAEHIAELSVDIIISSTMNRSQETAEIISKKTGKRVETSDLFVERRRPSEQLGKPKNDPVALESEKLIRENFMISGYRYSDEENFEDLKERASRVLDFLVKRPEETILVVTHGLIMRIVLAYVVFGKELTARECQQFILTFHMANTGITAFGYNENQKNPWWVWFWNEHSHLDE